VLLGLHYRRSMISSRQQLVVVGLVMGLVGYGVGALLHRPAAPQESTLVIAGQKITPMPESANASDPAKLPQNGSTEDAETANAAVEHFWTTLTIADESERFAAWKTLLQKMTAANGREVRDLFRKMDKQGRWFSPEWEAFWPRWGEVDAAGALNDVNQMTGMKEYQPMLAEKIFRGWAKGDRAGAHAWLEANAESPMFEGALRGYLNSLAKADLRQATDEALSLGAGRPMKAPMEVLTEQALQQGQMEGMLAWWRGLPGDTEQSGARMDAVASVYQRLRRGDDDRTGEWLASLAGTPYHCEAEINDFTAKLGRADPAAAVKWVSELQPSSDGQFSGMATAVEGLANRDPAALESWIRQLPQSPLREQAEAAYARHNEKRRVEGNRSPGVVR
jgi:hypothetical protein